MTTTRYAPFIDALPAEYEVEARNLAPRDSIGRDDIIKAVRERHHRLSGNRKRGANASHAGQAMYEQTAAKEKAESRGSTEKAPWMPAAMAAAPKLPKVVPPR